MNRKIQRSAVTVQGASSASLLSVSCHLLQLVTWAFSAGVCRSRADCPHLLLVPVLPFILCCVCPLLSVDFALSLLLCCVSVSSPFPLLCSGRLDEESFVGRVPEILCLAFHVPLGIAPEVVSTACVRRCLYGRLWSCYTRLQFVCL